MAQAHMDKDTDIHSHMQTCPEIHRNTSTDTQVKTKHMDTSTHIDTQN
jgi:hypothetical protein